MVNFTFKRYFASDKNNFNDIRTDSKVIQDCDGTDKRSINNHSWFVTFIHSVFSLAYPDTARDWDDEENRHKTPRAEDIIMVNKR